MRRIILVTSLLALAACEKKISADKVQDIIKNMFAEKGITVSPACPDGLDIKKGYKFKCVAKESGRELTINVEITDEKEGMVQAVLDGLFVFEDKLAAAIKTSEGVTIKCPKPTMVITPTQPLTCDITDSPEFKHLEVHQEDAEGKLSWKKLP